MGVAQKPRSWPRWVNFTPALVGHFYIGGDIIEIKAAGVVDQRGPHPGDKGLLEARERGVLHNENG